MFNFEQVPNPHLVNISYPTPSFFRLLPRVYHNKELAPAVWPLVYTGSAEMRLEHVPGAKPLVSIGLKILPRMLLSSARTF